jgi:hypothetical protein
MKLVNIIAAAVGGAVLIVAAAAVMTLRAPTAIFSASQVARALQIHGEMLGALLVISFGILVFVICFVAAHADLSRARARLSPPSGYAGPRRSADSIRAAFAGTSIEIVAARLDDALGDSSLAQSDPDWLFYWPRVARLEIWRALIRRLVGLEIVTILLYSFYAAAIVQFGPSQISLDLSALPWPNVAAATAILVCGGWLWIDDTIESVIAEMGPFRRRQLRDRFAGTSEIAEMPATSGQVVVEEAMFERLAALLVASKDEILAAKSLEHLDDGEDAEVRKVLRSISEVSLRTLSQLTRITAEQEKVQSTLQKRDADAADLSRRWTEFDAKLNSLESALHGLGQAVATDGASSITLPAHATNTVSGRAVAANLEAILAELKGLAPGGPEAS